MGKVAVIGAGAIGTSWAALFAACGHEVVASDPRPEADAEIRDAVERLWPSLQRQGLVAEGASPASVTTTTDAAVATEGAFFVQENAPERLDLKHALYRTLDDAAEEHAIIASSSSGLTASDLQAACTRFPGRVVIGHPFNPPHLVPLVEVVGGSATTSESIDIAMAFYRACGRTPIHIRAELPGHVTNRLQAALWREAYWLVSEGVVSVADIDTAISNGPGLRWALAGPFATQHLSGGPGGIAHILEHLGPPMVDWWHTMQTPEWTRALQDAVIAGVDNALDGIDDDALLAERDRLLEALLVSKAGAPQSPRTPALSEAPQSVDGLAASPHTLVSIRTNSTRSVSSSGARNSLSTP